MIYKKIKEKKIGSTGIRTRIVGFKVQSDSHYTIPPLLRMLIEVGGYYFNWLITKSKSLIKKLFQKTSKRLSGTLKRKNLKKPSTNSRTTKNPANYQPIPMNNHRTLNFTSTNQNNLLTIILASSHNFMISA